MVAERTNGASKGPTAVDTNDLSDWLMVQSHGKTYLGRPTQAYAPKADIALDLKDIARIAVEGGNIASLTLDPVFEYVTAMAQTPQGMAVAISARPCFSLLSVQRLRIVSYGTAFRVGDLAREDRKGIESQIRETLEAIGHAKAAVSGLLVAGADVLGKLPPMGGRR